MPKYASDVLLLLLLHLLQLLPVRRFQNPDIELLVTRYTEHLLDELHDVPVAAPSQLNGISWDEESHRGKRVSSLPAKEGLKFRLDEINCD